MRLTLKRLGLLSAASASLVFLAPAAAQAQAEVFRFSQSYSDSFTDTFACRPDLSGVVTQTENVTGQVVDTGKRVFSVHGVSTYEYRLDLSDGAYAQSSTNRDRFVFVASGEHIVSHHVDQQVVTLYDADGQPLGKMTIHVSSQIVYTDKNNNFQPDPGEITVQHDLFKVRCI